MSDCKENLRLLVNATEVSGFEFNEVRDLVIYIKRLLINNKTEFSNDELNELKVYAIKQYLKKNSQHIPLRQSQTMWDYKNNVAQLYYECESLNFAETQVLTFINCINAVISAIERVDYYKKDIADFINLKNYVINKLFEPSSLQKEINEYFPESIETSDSDIVSASTLMGKELRYDCLVLNSPFADDINLIVKQYTRLQKIRTIDCINIKDIDLKKLKTLFDELSVANSNNNAVAKSIFYIKNIELLKQDERFNILCSFLNKQENALILISYPFCNRDSYNSLREQLTSKSTLNTILSMPNYTQFVKIIKNFLEENIIDEKFIQENCFCLGYSGLIGVLKNSNSDNWMENVCDEKKKRIDDFDRFIKDKEIIINPNSLLDSEWHYKYTVDIPIPVEDETQDWMTVEQREGAESLQNFEYNILERIINNKECDMFEKCGWALSYCLFGAQDDSYYNEMEGNRKSIKKERELRWNIAYDCLAVLMRVKRGELWFDISKDNQEHYAYYSHGEGVHLCSEVLDFKLTSEKKKSLNYAMDTLLHELYHSIQYTLIDNANRPKMLWFYEKEFEIEPHRKAEWELNRNSYVTAYSNKITDYINKEQINNSEVEAMLSNFYMNQVLEADARIFAKSVMRRYHSAVSAGKTKERLYE